MAVKRRRKATTAAPPARRRRRPAVAVKRKAPVRRRAKKGMLSEMFNPAMATAGFKSTLSGAMGGGLSALVDKMIPATDPTMSALYKVGGGFILATMAKMPNVGAGMAAVGAYQLIQSSGMLSDDNADYAEDIEMLPIVMNDDGYSLQEWGPFNDGSMLYDNGLMYNAGFSNLNY